MPARKYSIALYVLGLFLLLQACSGKGKVGSLDLDKLDAYIEKSRQEWQVPGLSIAIVSDDSVVFAKGYGVREYGKTGRVDENTVFGIASLTKAFTASALAILEDEGKIDWDDPVQMHLPDFKLYDPWVTREIRIRDLLCHRSGFKTFSGDLLWFETSYSRSEILRRLRYLKPAYGFRYTYGYSNLMYLTAGEIIPAVSDTSWDDFVTQRITGPLGMERTFLRFGELSGDSNVAMPHFVDLLNETTEVLPHMQWDNVAPAGAMKSCATDICQWIRLQLAMGEWNGKQLISSENLWETRKLHTIRPLDRKSGNVWPSKHFSGYGLGWQMYDYHGWKIIGHEGATDGMLCRLVMVPEKNLGFIILTNSINTVTTAIEYYILDQFYQGKSYDWSSLFLENIISYQKDERSEREAYLASGDRSLPTSLDMDEYKGLYGCDLYGNVEVRGEEGGLVMDFLPSARLIGDLEHFSADTFLIRMRGIPYLPEGTVKFYLDADGNVAEVRVDIPNPDFDFTELELKRTRKKDSLE